MKALSADAPAAVGVTTGHRGYSLIGDLAVRMVRLAEFLTENRHDSVRITIKRADWDLLRRWPRAAADHGFLVTRDLITWRGFQVSPDNGPGRYEKEDATR